ncbi:hypothetical protein ACFC4C_07300 [Streptomyces sp. NPDC056039]|uniref:hypothetical protein n=1 Tax=Streptomyces sp. NPDC056039 TaxID=3345687 RepID=UPI0035DC7BE7
MADEQYRWLDRETAERLLSGEPLEAVDGADRGEAERLARTLGALSASPPLTSEELPGEAAAMAAFRKVRAERADAAAALAAPGATGATRGQAAAEVVDAGLVRIGTPRGSGGGSGSAPVPRPRWTRPARLALAAVLAVGMVGGVAVAAGTGVLTPFGGDEPDPGASVSAAVSPPGHPLASPSPSDAVQGGSTPDITPDDASSGPAAGGAGASGRDDARDDARDDTAPKPGPGKQSDRPGDSRGNIASACRDLRDGKRLNADRRRALRDAAGGTRVWKYCKGLLSTTGTRSTDRYDGDSGTGRHQSNKGKNNQDENKDRDRDRYGDRRQDRDRYNRNDDDDDARRSHTRQSLAPLRPAVSYSVKISWPRV